MSLSNYPPGHPTGVSQYTLTLGCDSCGATTVVAVTYERDVNATTLDPEVCPCGEEWPEDIFEDAEPEYPEEPDWDNAPGGADDDDRRGGY